MDLLLRLEAATADNVQPFGGLVAALPGRSRGTRFYGDAVALYDAPIFQSDADTCLSLARIEPRPHEVTWMERHFKHTQAFLPLNGQPWAAVLAPPGSGFLPDLAAARALRFEGNQGLVMHLGTWHEFPFAVGAPVELVVVLRNETNRDLERVEHGEAVGEDLEKRNVVERLGARIRWVG